ncbi:MAG TPA: hypothetical protein DCZ40_08880 [Lachnospiraceae bacterium]|nr:hypothetical protein [Lachnospiraceae bacterium]
MENQRFMQEGIDGKRILLLFLKKIWFFAAAILAGAVIGSGIYLAVHVLFPANREYEQISKMYLNFNCEPEDFNELSYNGYTWNDLMATDPILNYTMENLPPETDRNMVIGATRAEILSDIRLLTITITTDTPELTERIMEATQAALVHLGETDTLFDSIEIYSTEEPRQIVWDNRTAQAAATGMVIAFFVSLAAAGFYYVMDGSVYVAGDVEKRYGIPVIGIFTEEKEESAKGASKEFFERFRKSLEREFFANYCYMGRNMKAIGLVSTDSMEDAKKAGDRIKQLTGRLRKEENKAAGPDGNAGGFHGGRDGAMPDLVYGMPEEDTGIYEKLREADGVIVAVRFAGRNGKAIERLLDNLKKQDCKVMGAVIVDAKESFLRMYYLGRRG